ncbi:MAG: 50S ribosomal protein L30 [Candidatus Helarchaeota archaeon]
MSQVNEKGNKKLIVVRIRGNVNVRKEVKDTLKMLRLNRINHAVLIDDRKSYLGMLQKVKDYTTWGEINEDTLELLLKKRGRLEGRKKLTDQYLKKYTEYQSIKDLSKAIISNEINIHDIQKIKPVFRLRPPKGGHHGKIKRPYKAGGVLGNRNTEINDLIMKMI